MSKIRIFQFLFASDSGVKHYAMNNWKWLDMTKFECDFGTLSKVIDFENLIIVNAINKSTLTSQTK